MSGEGADRARRPEQGELGRDEIHAVLARNRLGRIAYCRGDAIHIEPLHYVYSGGWIYGRTSQDTKRDMSGDTGLPVAFEVDEVDGLFDWRSVIVHGGFYTLSKGGTAWERDERHKAIEILRTLVPGAFTPDDPTPTKDVVFRIAVQEVSGRSVSTADSAARSARASAETARLPAAAGAQG